MLEGFCAAVVWVSLTGSANRALLAPPPPAEEEEAVVVVGIVFGFFGSGAPLLVVPVPPPPEDLPTHAHIPRTHNDGTPHTGTPVPTAHHHQVHVPRAMSALGARPGVEWKAGRY